MVNQKNLANFHGEFGEFYKFLEGRQIPSEDFILKNQQRPVPKNFYNVIVFLLMEFLKIILSAHAKRHI